MLWNNSRSTSVTDNPFKLRTTSGRLIGYAFACGYIEKRVSSIRETHMSFWSGVYIVTTRIQERVHKRVFRTLRKARNYFNRCGGKLVRPAY